ncbi:MAG: type II secretion system protein [Smithella sp.]|jgi:prepilin-type N-terminal cleavage/methylation domain-containing protein
MFNILKMMKRDRRGFTLVEVIVSLVVAGVLAAMLVNFLGTGFLKSANPAVLTENGTYLNSIMDKMVSDYVYQVATAVNNGSSSSSALTAFKSDVETPNKFGTGYTVAESCSAFTATGSTVIPETSTSCSFGSTNSIYKVTVTYQGLSATALYTE